MRSIAATTPDGLVPPAAAPANAREVQALFRKLDWRMLPLLVACYMVAYIDRVNIGYAQLQMQETLSFGPHVYGLGAGIFFIGYFLFEVPSNMLLQRIGARATLLRIMLCWGVVAAGMMFVQTPTQFYVLRFFLGVFEAGFLPGVVYYLTQWYPSARRGRVIALFMSAAVVAGVVAGPLSGAIMKYFDGLNGWSGWQWMFLVQGLPASVLGIVAWFWLQDSPAEARWLGRDEKALLHRELARDDAASEGGHGSLRELLRDPRVYLLAFVDFLLIAGNYALVFWMPTLIKGWGVKDLVEIGFYAAIPQVVGIVGMILVGRSSDRRQERRWHYALSAFLAAAGLGLTVLVPGHFTLSRLGLCVALVGVAAATPLFITVVTEYLAKPVKATGIAFVNSLAILGGAVSPPVIGLINSRAGNPAPAMVFVLTLYVASGLLMLLVLRRRAAR